MKTYFQRSTKERENLKKSDLKGFFFSMVESSQNFNHASNHFGSGKIQLGGVISSPTPYCWQRKLHYKTGTICHMSRHYISSHITQIFKYSKWTQKLFSLLAALLTLQVQSGCSPTTTDVLHSSRFSLRRMLHMKTSSLCTTLNHNVLYNDNEHNWEQECRK